jgi:hypothetical protein
MAAMRRSRTAGSYRSRCDGEAAETGGKTKGKAESGGEGEPETPSAYEANSRG